MSQMEHDLIPAISSLRSCNAGTFAVTSLIEDYNTYISDQLKSFLFLVFLEHTCTNQNALYCGSHAVGLDSNAWWNQTRCPTLDSRIGWQQHGQARRRGKVSCYTGWEFFDSIFKKLSHHSGFLRLERCYVLCHQHSNSFLFGARKRVQLAVAERINTPESSN